MAGLVPAIHTFLPKDKDVDARHKAGHDKSHSAATDRTGALRTAEAMPISRTSNGVVW